MFFPRVIVFMFLSKLWSVLSGRIVGTFPVSSNIILPSKFYISENNQILLGTKKKLYIEDSDIIRNKKMISISPGGFKGFYLMGITTYIKENYDLSNFIFSGASAGAWNSLLMTYKGDPIDIALSILDEKHFICKNESIINLENLYKSKILKDFQISDFDLSRLFIGVTTVQNFNIKTRIYSDFTDLEDTLNCCIASSHIPFITGGPFNKYHDVYAFDGGFSKYPYLNTVESTLHISPSIWRTAPKKIYQIQDYTTLFTKNKYNFLDLFDQGYNDAKKHTNFLDKKLL